MTSGTYARGDLQFYENERVERKREAALDESGDRGLNGKSEREMATICFRPPPLPPAKKSANAATAAAGNRHRAKQDLLSSTYLSFRDPAEDEILTVEEIELTEVSHTNSLSRSGPGRDPKVLLSRSHSEGNLNKKGTSSSSSGGLSINRYMKVLSGSWRNLLNSFSLAGYTKQKTRLDTDLIRLDLDFPKVESRQSIESEHEES
ncbi:hypothetical protein NQ318_019369 [Aromia moschata]|uniref:Uncharacterized protein n=1 Tax=Aromia moschata TaxID=1265417 RepID=A0AAV8XZH1_9CUCU|nr:hypothetical protein NQ318_019369 [Aromia moschata]